MVHGGQEHDVYEPTGEDLIYKLTKRSSFGRFPGFSSEFGVSSRSALASEYLERLLIQNELFGDDTRLVGVAVSSGGSVYTLTSQPFITGRAATSREIRGLMKERGFEALDELLGAWIRPADRLMALDAVGRNVLVDEAGRILPIDLILGHLKPAPAD